jgi:hypothetical protein
MIVAGVTLTVIIFMPLATMILPAAASTDFTIPPPPLAHAASSAAWLWASADAFITITRTAFSEVGVSPAVPVTSALSPAAMSLSAPAVADFRSLLPGGTTMTFAVAGTVTVTS